MTLRLPWATALLGIALLVPAISAADKPSLTDQLDAAKEKVVDQQRHMLAYKFTPDETTRWKVVHLVTVETKISGNTQVAKTRSVSQKAWQTAEASAEKAEVIYMIDWVDMWQSLTDRPEVRYDSRTDSKAPPQYEMVAKTVGNPLAKVSLSMSGEVVERENLQSLFNSPGLGDFAVRLPTKPITIGTAWSDDEIVPIRLPQEKVVKPIKVRREYRLEKVKFGVATISVTSKILTPVHDPKVKSQLIQRLTSGEVKFDIDAGRIISKHLELDERVIGFNGDDSVMHYLARFTEDLVEADEAAERVAEKPE
jgi:hypothetical protein